MLGRALSRRALLRAFSVALVAPAATAANRPLQNGEDLVDATADDVSTVEDVSPVLMRAICAHCAAFVNYSNLVRDPTPANVSAIGDAIEEERSLLLDVVMFPATNQAERNDQANYLSSFRRRCDAKCRKEP
ncbi:hypothetical protein RFM23_21045 [Mesorhizobium abyssinicae]|uniref:Uncharacterized protein n=1 Tax=Mesorhizobium abyssinicae TaxID=1209958 RepID=A0ABU5AS29_9HYPH|nr:hypothetical protein [Mesorhizobium abyssinicae]MDX8540110.1 hypothetical protein [Mesorhizobium abyssinicae]